MNFEQIWNKLWKILKKRKWNGFKGSLGKVAVKNQKFENSGAKF